MSDFGHIIGIILGNGFDIRENRFDIRLPQTPIFITPLGIIHIWFNSPPIGESILAKYLLPFSIVREYFPWYRAIDKSIPSLHIYVRRGDDKAKALRARYTYILQNVRRGRANLTRNRSNLALGHSATKRDDCAVRAIQPSRVCDSLDDQ